MDAHTELTERLLKENQKARKWNTTVKLLFLVYLVVVTLGVFSSMNGVKGGAAEKPHTALVPIKGVIKDGGEVSANQVVGPLRDAFKAEQAKAIVLAINSPGGSPVQAGYIYDEIKRLKALHPDKTVYAVISDVGASGGYYIAAAADQIYANRASLVGSIGVTASGFGFVDLIDKLGVERRTYTSGDHKNFLDPFLDARADEQEFWGGVLSGVHQQFKQVVVESRGDRIDAEDAQLFSGLIWNGEQALELGLIDALGSAGYVAREIVGEEDIVSYAPRKPLLEQLTKGLGTSLSLWLDREAEVSLR
ncbi:MAG: S49 family peptidase [Pseudomonadota bacterium]|nr:S49 family peptidase [Pseudomonadota bacterium]